MSRAWTNAAHGQQDHRVRMEWGPTGGVAIADGADIAVVVDVLSFTTTLSVAVSRGLTVLPFRWRDARAEEYAAQQRATLAIGRFEALERPGHPTLSPASFARVSDVDRVVLPSPNGSTICFELAERGVEVVGASLRNRAAVVRWLRPQVASGATVAIVAAGERWPDGSLRPAVEDLWGAGAVLAGLGLPTGGEPMGEISVEARVAAAAYLCVADDLELALNGCAGGRELSSNGFAVDVEMAAGLDRDDVVPLMRDGEFGAA